jgi:hypothetical protein
MCEMLSNFHSRHELEAGGDVHGQHRQVVAQPSATRSSSAGDGDADTDAASSHHGMHTLRVCVSWMSGLETVAVPEDGVIADVADAVLAAPDVPATHKLFIFRGFLLDAQSTVKQWGLHEGCVLHMVLNEAPFRGRPLHVRRLDDGKILTLSCSANFSISDVKHELACFPGGRSPTKMRLAFAGRELEDRYTLREYNIQKPSVLLLLPEPSHSRGLSNFVSRLEPERDAIGVACDTSIGIHFKRIVQDETHYWGQMLGSPDIHSLTLQGFRVTRKSGAAGEPPIRCDTSRAA